MSESKYSVVSLSVEELLATDSIGFEVPPFQRSYSWGADEISELYDDLFGTDSLEDSPYFLGSIVLATSTEDVGVRRSLVLDGQQRLTTISLIIAMLYTIASQQEADVRYLGYLRSKLFSYTPSTGDRPKLVLQSEDQRIYGDLLNEPLTYQNSKYKRSQLGVALNQIHVALQNHMNADQSKSVLEHCHSMSSKLLTQVEMVKITAPSERDAFRLFETLNDRGLALSAADLVKNKLFSRCHDTKEVSETWADMLATIKNENAVDFLRYYWIATNNFVRKQNLYDKYKNYIESLNPTEAEDFSLHLLYAAETYTQIADPILQSKSANDRLELDALRRLNDYKAKSCRSVLLACSENVFRHRASDFAKIIQLCESIMVRYSIIGGGSSNSLEKFYSKVCQELGASNKPLNEIFMDESLKERLKSIPSDDEFKQKIMSVRITRVGDAWRAILTRLNAKMGSGETKPEGPHIVHIDHILPQAPSNDCLEECGLSRETALAVVPKIGNLTLLSKTMNQRSRNKAFSVKKTESFTESEFAMTQDLLKYDTWGEHQVEERSAYFAELLVEIYPHPFSIISA